MNEKINLQDLVALLAEKADITKKDAETLIKECFDTMEEGLVKDKLLKIRNLGTFKLIQVEDRESIDVSTGERVIIPAHYKVTFSPDIELAETINIPYAFFENVEIEENDPSEKTEDNIEEEIEEEDEEESSEEPKIEKTIAEEEVVNSPGRLENMQEEEEEEEELEDKEEEPTDSEEYYNEDSKPTKNTNGLFLFFFIIASLLILFFVGRYFCPKINFGGGRKGIPDSVMVISNTVNKSAISDRVDSVDSVSTATAKPDSVTLQVADIPKEQTPDTSVVRTVPPAPPLQTENQSSKEFINKTHRVLAGERLTLIALREYGHKAFWVYIYEENKNRISNPSLINPGTVINIPPAAKYEIDKNNPESVKKALELEQKYKH